MKEVAALLIASAVALGIAMAVIGPGGDLETFTSPPEVVAAEFLRAVVAGRYDRAAEKLDEEGPLSEDAVRALAVQLEQRAGDAWRVEAEQEAIGGGAARALGRVSGETADAEVRFALARSRGEWKITLWTVE